jgi:putative MATE family efflux protein
MIAAPGLARADLTRGSLVKHLFVLSWPTVLAMSLQTSYNLVDIFWVGRVGPTAIAAVSLAGVVFFVILAIGQTLGSGAVAMIARYYGAKQFAKVEHVLGQAVLLSTMVAFGSGAIGIVFCREIVSMLGGRAEVLELGTEYLRIVSVGFIFQLLMFCVNYSFRGIGDMRTPMFMMIASTVLNIVLDPIMILGMGPFPRMEVRGAAYATMIAKLVGFLLGFTMLVVGRSGIRFKIREAWPLERVVVKGLLAIGVPVGVSYGLMALSGLVVFRLAARFGAQAIAALGIGMRVIQIASLPVVGIGIATTTLVGQNLGARKTERVEETAYQSMAVSSAIMILLGLVFFFNSSRLVGVFTNHVDVIRTGATYIKIASVYLLFIGLTTSMTGSFRGSGYTLPPMFAALVKLVLLFGLSYLLSDVTGIGVDGIWWAMLISYGIEAVIVGVWFSRGEWKSRRMITLEQEAKNI